MDLLCKVHFAFEKRRGKLTLLVPLFLHGSARACRSHVKQTKNSSADEIANVNFLYDDIVHVLQNAIDSCIPPQIDAAVMCGTHVYQIQ